VKEICRRRKHPALGLPAGPRSDQVEHYAATVGPKSAVVTYRVGRAVHRRPPDPLDQCVVNPVLEQDHLTGGVDVEDAGKGEYAVPVALAGFKVDLYFDHDEYHPSKQLFISM
jgi:hypothetical protein